LPHTYDALGRLTDQKDLRSRLGTTQTTYEHQLSYNASGQVSVDTVTQVQETNPSGTPTDDTYVYTTTNSYGTGTGYGLGSLLSSATVVVKDGSDAAAPDTSTTDSYSWYDSAVLSSTSYKPDVTAGTTYTTTDTLSASGVITSASIADSRARTVTFVNDALDQTIRRDEADGNTSTGDPHQVWYRFDGRQLAYLSNDANYDGTDYQDSVADRLVAAGTGAFHNGQGYGATIAQFGEVAAPITTYAHGADGGGYTVSEDGESLSSVAEQMWGDASLWYVLAQANGLSGDASLVQGQHLTIPAGIQRNSFTATTFKPYDPAETLGNISPSGPAVKKPKCGVLGQILVAVIAVAIAVALPESAPGLSSFWVGLTGAVAGDFFGQLAGMAIGTQDDLSFKELAMTAVTAGVGDGLDVLGVGGTDVFAGAVRSMMVNAVSQGIGIATGLQHKFSFAGVAAAGVGSLVGGAIGDHVSGGATRLGQFAAKALASTADDIANAATRSLIDGTDFGDNIVAALPSALADLVSDGRGTLWGGTQAEIDGQTAGANTMGGGDGGAGGGGLAVQMAADAATMAQANGVGSYGESALPWAQPPETFHDFDFDGGQNLPQTAPNPAPAPAPAPVPRPPLKLVPPAPPPAEEPPPDGSIFSKIGGLIEALGADVAAAAVAINTLWTPPAGGKERFTVQGIGSDVTFELTPEITQNNIVIYGAIPDPKTGPDDSEGDIGSTHEVRIGRGEFNNGVLTIFDPEKVGQALGHPLNWDMVVIRADADGNRTGFGFSTTDDREREIVQNGAAAGLSDQQISAALENYRAAKAGGADAAEGATRRLATVGDSHFSTAEDALAEALKRYDIDPSTVETTKMYGKNPNLLGPNGEPWEVIRGLNSHGEIVQFDHHPYGHFYSDTNEFELPHYHGPNGEHLTYGTR
jgi:hypothetical protein